MTSVFHFQISQLTTIDKKKKGVEKYKTHLSISHTYNSTGPQAYSLQTKLNQHLSKTKRLCYDLNEFKGLIAGLLVKVAVA